MSREESEVCDFCNSEAGKPRPLGQYIVELTTIEVAEGEEKKVCQSCIVHQRKIPDKKEKLVQRTLKKFKNLL